MNIYLDLAVLDIKFLSESVLDVIILFLLSTALRGVRSQRVWF